MAEHPYRQLPPRAFWRGAVAGRPVEEVDPVGPPKFLLGRGDRIATAGSCFAQHIARYLAGAGFNYLVTETAHPLIPPSLAQQFNYGLFTARYANIYTSRQLLQLLQRAYGLFTPRDDRWDGEHGFLDPFRPQIQPGGFATAEEYAADRAQHFAAVRRMVEELDCFIFTLGLTECWMARADGATYPLCPGTSGGTFDPDAHLFHNLDVMEVLADLAAIRAFIKERNPRARFILTVSPVPLVASASGDHVLSATIYSKSVLRAAAGAFSRDHDDVAYFPSYELITGPQSRGRYYADDLRGILEEGVAQVMGLFLRHYGGVEQDAVPTPAVPAAPEPAPSGALEAARVVCEEEALARFG